MTDPIRVALALTADWHRVPGGTAVAANALAGALARRDDVALTGVGPGRRGPTEGFDPPVAVERLRVGLPWLYDSWHWLRRPLISSVVPDADVVHTTVPVSPPRERMPVVSTVHDLLPLEAPGLFTRRGAWMMRRGLDRIRREAAMVMVPTEHGRTVFTGHGFDPSRLTVVPLGVETPPAPGDGELTEVLDRLGIDQPYVLFVGTAEPRKGLDVLVSAVEALDRDGLTLVLVGPRGWGGVDHTTSSRVVVTGYLPPTDLLAVRAAASVCAVPSRAEGFGLPALEAMAAGVPLVTTTGTPMEEFATGAAHLVAPDDPAGLATALADVLDDPALATRLATAGRKRARCYTWDRTAELVANVYREVLG